MYRFAGFYTLAVVSLQNDSAVYTKKIEEDLDCGIRVAMKIFGGKWKMCILDAIGSGITRPAELHKSIPDATLRVIEMQLAELLAYGVVVKCSEDVYPRKSEYALTSLGKSILPVLAEIDRWGTTHAPFVREKHRELMGSD
jgi:DNA-binding HxlR family transcriptional regulator